MPKALETVAFLQLAANRQWPPCQFWSGSRSTHNIPQARYLPLPVISRRSSSATRSCAARGVTLSSRAISPADRIGRATTRSASAGRLEFERRPTTLRSSRRRASSLRSCSFIPHLAASAKPSRRATSLVVESRARRRSRAISRRPVFTQRRCDRVRERPLRIAPTRSLPSQALCCNGSISSQARSAIPAASNDGVFTVASRAWRHEAMRAFSSQSRS